MQADRYSLEKQVESIEWGPTHERHMGVVFQDELLFPHMSTRENLTYGRTDADPSATSARSGSPCASSRIRWMAGSRSSTS